MRWSRARESIWPLGYEIAQQTQRPRWNKGDFFEQLREAGAMLVDSKRL